MLEQSVRDLITKRVEALGYRIVLIKYFNRTGVLQIMIDFQDGDTGYIGIEDCMKVNEEITLLLRVNEKCAYDCAIEVSSPGIDRPLVSLSDFAKHKGQKVKLVMKELVNGARKWNATIVDVIPEDAARVVFARYDAQKVDVRLDEIESARLSLDEMNLFKH
jgi:ribosome maturation factor RimP